MGLLDGYDDPDQFDASGGLLGRLLSVQRQQGLLPSNFISPTSPGPVPAPAPLRQGWPDAPTLPVSSQGAAVTPKADPRDAQGQLASNDLATSGVKNGLRTALDDFYQQTIRQAGRDIAGYAHDAVNDPMGFLHAIGPTLGAAGPAASELPATIRGITGAITAARGARSQNLGDLTPGEVRQIQSVVNKAGRPLEVIGSAARGQRKPTSDIDYLVPHTSLPYYKGLERDLPGLDPEHGIVPGVGNPEIGPSIRFEPK